MNYANGDKYVGEFKNSKFHGKGIYTEKDGIYDGNWKDNLRDGQGTYTVLKDFNFDQLRY